MFESSRHSKYIRDSDSYKEANWELNHLSVHLCLFTFSWRERSLSNLLSNFWTTAFPNSLFYGKVKNSVMLCYFINESCFGTALVSVVLLKAWFWSTECVVAYVANILLAVDGWDSCSAIVFFMSKDNISRTSKVATIILAGFFPIEKKQNFCLLFLDHCRMHIPWLHHGWLSAEFHCKLNHLYEYFLSFGTNWSMEIIGCVLNLIIVFFFLVNFVFFCSMEQEVILPVLLVCLEKK